MTEEERRKILSEDYGDIILDNRSDSRRFEERFPDAVFHVMNDAFAILHIPANQINSRTIVEFGYSAIPKLFGLTSEISLEASGVEQLRTIPALNLRGEGVLIGIVDTGIDYTNPAFLKSDGTSKIVSIWDQTIDIGQGFSREYEFESYFGTEYLQEQINQALVSENPLDIVPSIDEVGHGTVMAGIAAGTPNESFDFFGVAPDAELVIVKLRQAKEYLKEFFSIPPNVQCFQENFIMWGIEYCALVGRYLNRPVVICLGLGTSQGGHDGRLAVSVLSNLIAEIPNIGFVVSAGNEGNRGRHYRGIIDPITGYNTVELNVGEGETGFSMEIWGDSPGIFSIDIQSPSGEYIPRVAPSLTVQRDISFIFERTVISMDYFTVEAETGDQLILLRFKNISPGVWRFNVYGQGELSNSIHIWLPMGDFITTDTYFIQPDIYTTIVSPGNAYAVTTVTAYNPVNNNLYVNSSRGYSRALYVKPSLAAPGVDYIAPGLGGEFIYYTGTGVAAAHTAGVVALVFEWSSVRGNLPGMDNVAMKSFLIRGARRSPNISYPNRDWGYGILDVFNTFNFLRSNIGGF